jgi:hypothetical protein
MIESVVLAWPPGGDQIECVVSYFFLLSCEKLCRSASVAPPLFHWNPLRQRKDEQESTEEKARRNHLEPPPIHCLVHVAECESREGKDTQCEEQRLKEPYHNVECMLPTIVCFGDDHREEPLGACESSVKKNTEQALIGIRTDRWIELYTPYNATIRSMTASTVDSDSGGSDEEGTCVDVDPWVAAKRGDLKALMSRPFDWKKEDAFQNTPLYYACHSGCARGGLRLVQFLLDEWPDDEIPRELLDRCKKNALNASVARLLANKSKYRCSEAILKNGNGCIEDFKREEEDLIGETGLLLLFGDQGDY